MSVVSVTVPGTTANLGPGFDCLGAALTLHNRFVFSNLETETGKSVQIEVTGLEADRVKANESNLAYRAFLKVFEQLGQKPPAIHLAIDLGVPLARGLGSSATAIVGGLMGANALAGSPLSQNQLLNLAIEIEGHPDNVVPALLGGCQLTAAAKTTDWAICNIPWHEQVVPIVAIPNFELSTAEARKVLPGEYSRADAIFNIAHLGLLLRGLETGQQDWISAALQDRIHQPYRKALIQGYDAVEAAALAAGAYGLVISGAGPTLLALASPATTEAVKQAMTTAWSEQGIEVLVSALAIDTEGARIDEH